MGLGAGRILLTISGAACILLGVTLITARRRTGRMKNLYLSINRPKRRGILQVVYDQRYGDRINTSRRLDMAASVILEVKGPAGAGGVFAQFVTSLPLPLSRRSKYCDGLECLRYQ